MFVFVYEISYFFVFELFINSVTTKEQEINPFKTVDKNIRISCDCLFFLRKIVGIFVFMITKSSCFVKVAHDSTIPDFLSCFLDTLQLNRVLWDMIHWDLPDISTLTDDASCISCIYNI